MLIFLATAALAAPPTVSTRFESNQSASAIEAILAQATETSVKSVHWTVRSFARPKLEPLATACPAYTTSVEGGQFKVQCDGKDPFEWTIGKSAPFQSKEGETMTASLTRTGDVLVMDFRQEGGGKSFTYDFSGDDLTVTQQVYSKHLPVPMTWTLSYAKR